MSLPISSVMKGSSLILGGKVKDGDAKDTKVPLALPLGLLPDEEYVVVRRAAPVSGAVAATSATMAASPAAAGPPLVVQKSLSVSNMIRGLGGRGQKNLLHTLLPFSATMSSVGAAPGTIATVVTVYPDSNTTEWAAFAAIFDEYRCLGGRVVYTPDFTGRAIPAGGFTMDDNFVMVYDPLDGTALTSVRNGCEASTHKLSLSRFEASTAKTWSNLPIGGLVMPFSTPRNRPLANTAGSALDLAPGSWKKIYAATNNGPEGYLKGYGLTSFSATVIAVNLIVFLNIEFRIRK